MEPREVRVPCGECPSLYFSFVSRDIIRVTEQGREGLSPVRGERFGTTISGRREQRPCEEGRGCETGHAALSQDCHRRGREERPLTPHVGRAGTGRGAARPRLPPQMRGGLFFW